MPINPRHPCNHPGCVTLAEERFCSKHAKAASAEARAANRKYKALRTDGEFYSSVAWRKARALHLRQHPLCVGCEKWGKIKPATIVDHIVPVKIGGAPLDGNNLQSLCVACHNRKTGADGSKTKEGEVVCRR